MRRASADPTSHIFCLRCADSLGLSHPTAGHRRCPACQTVLVNPDDAVSTVLNPTEDYKTSVLSGMDPGTIVECAGRALGFWSYQTTQEMYALDYKTQRTSEVTHTTQILPGIPRQSSDGKVLQPQHADGQGHPQRQHRDILSAKQSCRSAALPPVRWKPN